ncbi:SCO2400 family protein [Streptomyces sp. D54]|uniref:SCO2400 family protein n=1 Tax=Streptomyces sp. D54 TaxID=1290289 RepID=UPI003CFA49F1
MDYCHPCRRHLNGALACAGCGTPAEALGLYAVPAPAGPAPGVRDARDGTAAPSGAGDARRGTRRDGRLDARRDARRGAGGRPDARPGSRRRVRGGHRRRGRTVLLGALGLLLAAGALSLAELAMEPGRDDTAADFVRESPSDPSGAPSEEESADEPRDPGPVGSRTAATTGPATDASPVGTRGASPSGAPSPEASDPDEPTTSPDPDDTAPPDATDSPPADPPEPDDPREPTTAPAPPPPPAEPTPTPTPSPTCTRFLWWCA